MCWMNEIFKYVFVKAVYKSSILKNTSSSIQLILHQMQYLNFTLIQQNKISKYYYFIM